MMHGIHIGGEVVADGVRVVADRAGLAELQRLIATTRSGLGAEVVMVGIEAAGHQRQTLVGHLDQQADLEVRLLNPRPGRRGAPNRPRPACRPAA